MVTMNIFVWFRPSTYVRIVLLRMYFKVEKVSFVKYLNTTVKNFLDLMRPVRSLLRTYTAQRSLIRTARALKGL